VSEASLAGVRAVRATAHFRLKRGLDLRLDGAPQQQRIEDAATVSRVALVGADAPGVRAELRVAPGDRVRLGQALWVDRRRPAVRFTAPGAGVVTSIERGARRRLEAVEIALEGDAADRALDGTAHPTLLAHSRSRHGSALALRDGARERAVGSRGRAHHRGAQ
jgi:Na+-transporting NADH:ubiquinone oxidoreductase subunit A